MNFYKLMIKYKTDNNDFTHTSMFPYGGTYNIPDEELDVFYSDYNKCIKNHVNLGILERPKDIGPMLVDVDIVEMNGFLRSLHTRERTVEYARQFQKCLLENTDAKSVDCWILEKRPYIDRKGDCKNGFHLHFPSVWMTKTHRVFITKLVKDTNIEQGYETLDSSASWNNWFLYGSRKNADQDAYKVEYILGTDGQQQDIPTNVDFLYMLSIRNNPTGVTNKVLDGRIPVEKPKPKIEPK